MSKSLTVKVPLTEAFENDQIFIQAAQAELVIPLEEGKHSVTTAAVEVGYIKEDKQPLRASIEFPYEYYSADDSFVMSESDFISDNPVRLKIDKGSDAVFCKLSTFDDYGEIAMIEAYWKFDEAQSDGLKVRLQKSLADANELVQKAAMDAQLLVHLKFNIPKEAEKFRLIYHKGQLVGVLNLEVDAETDFGDEYELVSIKSTGATKVPVGVKAPFANVIGSTGDPVPPKADSFIELYETVAGADGSKCASYNYMGFTCTPNKHAIGGHVILNTNIASRVPNGKKVYILPICTAHNNRNDVKMFNSFPYESAISLAGYHPPNNT